MDRVREVPPNLRERLAAAALPSGGPRLRIPGAILALSILTGARWLPERYKLPSHALTAGKSKRKRASPTGEPNAVLAGRILHFANS